MFIEIESLSEFKAMREEIFKAKYKYGLENGGVSSFICSGKIFPNMLTKKLFKAFPSMILELTKVELGEALFKLEDSKKNFPKLYVEVLAHNVSTITYKNRNNPRGKTKIVKYFCGKDHESTILEFIEELKAI